MIDNWYNFHMSSISSSGKITRILHVDLIIFIKTIHFAIFRHCKLYNKKFFETDYENVNIRITRTYHGEVYIYINFSSYNQKLQIL